MNSDHNCIICQTKLVTSYQWQDRPQRTLRVDAICPTCWTGITLAFERDYLTHYCDNGILESYVVAEARKIYQVEAHNGFIREEAQL